MFELVLALSVALQDKKVFFCKSTALAVSCGFAGLKTIPQCGDGLWY